MNGTSGACAAEVRRNGEIGGKLEAGDHFLACRLRVADAPTPNEAL